MSLFPEYNTHEIAYTIIWKILNGDFSALVSLEEIKEALKTCHVVIETKRNGFGEIIGYQYTLRENEKTIHS
jgi:hypothetical protein